ncbi:VPS9 domain-containing protein 1-like [Xenia sp. Carnegie-2017]|uniref:VPS9 domain-containing protein 1-like n=1 Tax=Xenia sp. Carnegie-2017 TaxID=2897299 RepID=UPI001F037749|nr:VPS9 domain-containing protein 1-like [Xenia sp. Carnegie-2017]
MSSTFAACLNVALPSIRHSTLLDSENRHKEAFCQYLSNVIYICGVIKDEAWQRELIDCHTPVTLKLFKLSSQCLERAQDLLITSKASGNNDEEDIEEQSENSMMKKSEEQNSQSSQASSNLSTIVPPMATPFSTIVHSPKRNRPAYVDEARRDNSHLLSAYRARMERREKQLTKRTDVTRRVHDVTSMNLSIFRKMAENIEIAKAREKSRKKKIEERQQRLLEEADRRMGPSSLLTTHDQIRKEIYVKVLEFEQESVWLVGLRHQLKSRPDDSTLIQSIISKVLATRDHPLTKCLLSYQHDVNTQLNSVPEDALNTLAGISAIESRELPDRQEETSALSNSESVENVGFKTSTGSEINMEPGKNKSEPGERELKYKKLLDDVVKNVQSSLEIIHSLFLLTYEEFSSGTAQDLCYAMVELTFFKPLWPSLLNLYRIVNYRREVKLAKIFKENVSCTPQSLQVPARLCLQPQNAETDILPYQNVVDELNSLVKYESPLEKLECIVRTSHHIVECVVDYYELQGKSRNSPEAAIGCDDLLPILSYVIMKSRLCQLISECNAMEDFISADYLMGEEGYSLTTFQTALAFLETLDVQEKTDESENVQNSDQNPPDNETKERL